ncbi:MAG: lysoplasmalogenase [Chloroflexi bacterium]|nr:lysoplasmalogenase [Chloroflexota bacterium]
MNTTQKICISVFLAFAIVYLAAIPFRPYPGHFIVKAIPIISLAIMAFTSVAGLQGKLLFTALLLSAAGDVTLSLGSGEYFIPGLGLFLIAHVVYIVTFSRDFKMGKSRIPIAAILVAYAVAMAIIMAPSLKEMAIPVFCYLVVITKMGIMAAFRASKSKMVLYGAVLFIISDSMIALNKFVAPVPASDYLIMITYYLAQFLIAYGYVREREPAT